MTVAAKDGFGGAARRARGGGSPWRRLWQVPLMLAGVVAFGLAACSCLLQARRASG